MKKMIKLMLLMCLLVGCSQKPKVVTEEEVINVTGLPVIKITTENEEEINKVEKESSNAEFEILNTNGKGQDFKLTVDEEGNYPITIKGRGNSSWDMPTLKKPYNIKFSEKTDLFGFGEAKKWSLIASWTDTSFLRNYIGYKLARQMNETTPDCEMVELIINGKYEGVYLLCEAYGINKHRVETLGDGNDVNGDGEITEFLIEADVRALQHNEPNKFLTNSDYWMVVKEPDEDEITSPLDERFLYVSEYFKTVDDSIVNLDHYEDYIDVDSLVDMYVINEYLKNPDWGFGNQPYYASTFMYLEEGGKVCFGPLWDCDLSMGRNDYREIEAEGFRDTYTPEGFLSGNTHWIMQLMKDPAFEAKVKERWEEFKPYIREMIDEIAPSMMEEVAKVQSLDFKAHGETNKDRTTEWSYRVPLAFEEECAYVLDFMEKRLAWLDEQWGE